jgi:hypothetical protein
VRHPQPESAARDPAQRGDAGAGARGQRGQPSGSGAPARDGPAEVSEKTVAQIAAEAEARARR